MKTRRHILAIGGGGFSAKADDTRIDDFAIELTTLKRPTICFLPTASGDSDACIDAFYAAFGEERAQASHVELFKRRRENLGRQIADADLLYIGGGNTANLLALWRLHGVDEMVTAAYHAGTVVVGVSAGASCLFSGSLTDSFGVPLTPLADGLGLIAGTFCAHYDIGKRRARYHDVLGAGFPGGFAVDDGAALHFVDGELSEVLTTRPTARAYTVHKKARIEELPLNARSL